MRYIYLMVLFLATLTSIAQSPSELTIVADIPYYNGPGYDSANHKLNLVIPNNTVDPPLLVWIGGGAWSKVNRQVEMDLAKKIAHHGIAVATLGHRLSAATWSDTTLIPNVKHPQHVVDVARALKFLVEHGDTYGLSSQRVIVGGFSSGAHLATLVAMDDTYLSDLGLSTELIKGVVAISGTFDIPHYQQILQEAYGKAFANRHIESVFGLSATEMANASPTNFIEQFDTPMLLISDRNMIRYHNYFEEALRDAEITNVESLSLFAYEHAELWRHLSHDEISRCRDSIIDFIKRDETVVLTQ